MATIGSALARVKSDLPGQLNEASIHAACEQVGYQWRERVLGPAMTVWVFIRQVMAGNIACVALRHMVDVPFTASAYCEARQRLALGVLQVLLRTVGHAARPQGPGHEQAAGLWRGHRTHLIDGSKASMPDTPALQEHFGQHPNQRPGCGFPMAGLVLLFDAATGMILDIIISTWRTGEMALAAQTHGCLERGDVLVGDRGYCSYAHLAMLLGQGLHGVFRAHASQVVDFTPGRPHIELRSRRRGRKGMPASRWVRALGEEDQVVEWFKPRHRPKWMSAAQYDALPDSILVRELRYTVNRRGFRCQRVTLVTTLLDGAAYPKDELAELYRQRWQVEVNLRHLKATMGMEVLKCKTVDGLLKELYVFALVYNLVRRVMLIAARQQGVDPDRISFIDTLRWLDRVARPGDPPPRLVINPYRPDRVEPRVLKRRHRPYPLMTQPRATLRQALLGEKAEAK